jgi:hypothetical protein
MVMTACELPGWTKDSRLRFGRSSPGFSGESWRSGASSSPLHGNAGNHREPRAGEAAIAALEAGADLLLYGLDPRWRKLLCRVIQATKSRAQRGTHRAFRRSCVPAPPGFRNLRWNPTGSPGDLGVAHEQAFFEAALESCWRERGALAESPDSGPQAHRPPTPVGSLPLAAPGVVREQLEPAMQVIEVEARPGRRDRAGGATSLPGLGDRGNRVPRTHGRENQLVPSPGGCDQDKSRPTH